MTAAELVERLQLLEIERQNFLRPLLCTCRIAMTRPDKPNAPDQAYRASAAA